MLKVLESLTAGQHGLISVLNEGTVKLNKGSNGHHVTQHHLKTFSNEENKHLLIALASHYVDIASLSGCCILQQCGVYRKQKDICETTLLVQLTESALVQH